MKRYYISEKPSFQDTHELANLAEDVLERIASLIEGQDTPNRASDLLAAIVNLKTKADSVCYTYEEEEEPKDIWYEQ